MHWKHPKIADRWEHEYKTPKNLPEHVDGKKDKKKDSKEASMNFPERVIDALQISAAALQKAEVQLSEKSAAEVKYAAKIAGAIDKCAKFGRIDDTQDEREKLAAWLATPEGALEVIEKLAEHETTPPMTDGIGTPVDKNGQPAGVKRASFGDYPAGGYVGRRTSEEPDSWRKLAQAVLG